jgi:hypothetical protein
LAAPLLDRASPDIYCRGRDHETNQLIHLCPPSDPKKCRVVS